MKKVLVIYFTQTGQLNRAMKATLAPLENQPDITLHYELIRPETPFPYPWSYMQFFDAFPETVNAVPCKLQPFLFKADESYDLIVIAYSPWFLSVCPPIQSFLKTPEAKQVMQGKPVITIIACRNMWLNAQEKMKASLKAIEANLVGNITYVDKSMNLVSLVTVFAFALGGVKDKFLGIFPKYGVSDKDLKESAPKYGTAILEHLRKSEYSGLQEELINLGAISIKSNLMLLEGRGRVLFPLYANYISKKGTAASAERRMRVRIFGIVLPTAILILSPVITIISRLAPLILSRKFKAEMDYYSRTNLR